MKVTKTYSIDESLFEIFDSLTNEKNINKSSFIEDVIKKYIKDNDMDTINKQYISKSDPDHIVTVLQQDQTYYILDDGSKIQRILFLHLFKPFTGVDTEDFFSKTNYVFEDIVEHIKKIDTRNIVEYSNDTIKSKITDYQTLYEKPLTGEDVKIKKPEKSEKSESINEIDPNIFFGKSNSIIKDIVDQLRQNNNQDQKLDHSIYDTMMENRQKILDIEDDIMIHQWKNSMETRKKLDENVDLPIINIKKSVFSENDKVNSSDEYNKDIDPKITDKLNEDIATLKNYYNNYKVGGFITKTKDELSDIMININNMNFSYPNCGDYFNDKIKLLNIVKVYKDAL